jgi:hypothetical protein
MGESAGRAALKNLRNEGTGPAIELDSGQGQLSNVLGAGEGRLGKAAKPRPALCHFIAGRNLGPSQLSFRRAVRA